MREQSKQTKVNPDQAAVNEAKNAQICSMFYYKIIITAYDYRQVRVYRAIASFFSHNKGLIPPTLEGDQQGAACFSPPTKTSRLGLIAPSDWIDLLQPRPMNGMPASRTLIAEIKLPFCGFSVSIHKSASIEVSGFRQPQFFSNSAFRDSSDISASGGAVRYRLVLNEVLNGTGWAISSLFSSNRIIA